MIHSRSHGLRSGAVLCALAGLSLGFSPLVAPCDAAAELTGEADETTSTWFNEMDAFFNANPELKDTKGSGWKPYNRQKWFYEQRMGADGTKPTMSERWKVWEKKREIESRMPASRNSWFSLGPDNFAGRMLAVDFDPNNASTVYAGGADGGVWRSTNSGASWTPLSDELPSIAIGGLAVSKTNSNIIVIGTGEATPNIDRVGGVGILRSTDAGATWITTDLSYAVSAGNGFHFVEAGPNGTFLAGNGSDGLWRSTDDGATWVQVKTGDEWTDAVWKPGDANRVYSVRGNGASGASVKVSTDDGLTWTKAGTGQPSSFQIGKSKLGVSGTTIYCYIGVAGTAGGIYGVIRSDDDGATWTDLSTISTGIPSSTSSSQSWYNLVCVADPNTSTRVIVGDVGLYRSGNSGVSFSSVSSGVHSDQHCIKYEPGSNTFLWLGGDGGMYRSTSDGGNGSWVDMNNGLVTYQFYDICVNDGPTAYYALGGTQDNGTDRWSGTTTWTSELGGDGMVCNISTADGTTVLGESQFGNHSRSTNSGLSFFGFNSGLTGSGAWVAPTAISHTNSSHSMTATSAGIFRSTNGSSWSNVSSHTTTWIDYSRVNGNYVWTVSGSVAHLTTNHGSTWTAQPSISPTIPVAGSATKILAHPTDLNTVFVTFSGYGSAAHIAKSTDLGVTWADVSGDFLPQPVNAIAIDPDSPSDWYIGTDVGVWHTSNNGVNWLPFETGLPNAVVVDLEIRSADDKLVAGTHGRGAWEVDIPPSGVVGVDVAVEGARNLMLDTPWPNPANGRTLLRYAAKSNASVSLKVYDVNGRLISDVEDFATGDGIIRTTPWHTDDVPAGVYFAVLKAGGVQKSQKITVIK